MPHERDNLGYVVLLLLIALCLGGMISTVSSRRPSFCRGVAAALHMDCIQTAKDIDDRRLALDDCVCAVR